MSAGKSTEAARPAHHLAKADSGLWLPARSTLSLWQAAVSSSKRLAPFLASLSWSTTETSTILRKGHEALEPLGTAQGWDPARKRPEEWPSPWPSLLMPSAGQRAWSSSSGHSTDLQVWLNACSFALTVRVGCLAGWPLQSRRTSSPALLLHSWRHDPLALLPLQHRPANHRTLAQGFACHRPRPVSKDLEGPPATLLDPCPLQPQQQRMTRT